MAKYRLKHRFEYVAMRGLGFFLEHAPYTLAMFLGWKLAWLFHFVVKYRREAAYDHIREVFPDADDKWVRKIAWQGWKNFVFNAIDIFRLRKVDLKWIEKHVENWEQVRDMISAHCKSGKGAVVASPHMGAAELAAVCLQKFGAPVFLITGKQKNELTDKRLNEMRASTGLSYVQVGSNMLKSVIRKLRDGGVLAFLADIRVANGGLKIDFLGTKAWVAPGMAMFAKRTDVPVFPFVITRKGWTKHRMEMFEPIVPDASISKQEDQQRITQAVFTKIEPFIYAMPEQWFWYNKNWILTPVSEETPEGDQKTP